MYIHLPILVHIITDFSSKVNQKMYILVDKHITIVLKLKCCKIYISRRNTEMNMNYENVLKNLENNNIQAFYAENCKAAVEIVKTLIKEGDTVTMGGSMSVSQSGVRDLIAGGKYNFLDRTREGITPEEIDELYRQTFFADAYFCSSNAVTENGELYNVDGNSNRVAAILYGPKSVIMIVGKNKIVKNIDEAINRVKTIAAPKNTQRLGKETYCRINGKCVSLNNDDTYMCDGCNGANRICRNYVICGPQRDKHRIKVILVNENLGY